MAGRSGPWLVVRAPAVYGPGDRETLAYFRAVAAGLCPAALPARGPPVADPCARTSPRRWRWPSERPPAGSVYEIDDGREGGYGYGDMASRRRSGPGPDAPGRWPSRGSPWTRVARVNALGQSLGGPVQILTPGKVNEIFHSDWTVHDRRLAAAIGFAAALRPRRRVRRHGLVVSPARMALEACETLRNKLLFHKESPFLPQWPCLTPGTGETHLRTAHELTVENDGMARHGHPDARDFARRRDCGRSAIHLEPYQAGEKPITGDDRDRQGSDHQFARDHGHGHGARGPLRRLHSR